MNAQKKSIVIKLDSLKKTGHKIEVLKFNYGNISCPCAQWAESKFNSEKGINKWVQTYFEAINDSIDKILNIDSFPLKVKVTGEYISKSGYPKNFKVGKGKTEPAPVFKVYKVKILKWN